MVRTLQLFGLLLLLLLAGGTAAYAQDPADANAVIEKYLTAIGGREKLKSIKDLTMTMTADIQGRTMEMETKLKMPNKYKQTSYMMGNEAGGTVYDGTKLSRNMRGQSQVKEGNEAFQEFLQNHPFPELYYDSLGIEKKLAGKEKVDGKDAYKVEYSAGDRTWQEYFDASSGLKVQRTATLDTPRGKSEVAIQFSNYKAVNGIMFPFVRSQKMGQFEMNMETQSVKINKGIDDKQFRIN
ncbi:hypothetical protein GCM10027275_35980 [Rhabdobacter roseus]|uniref:Outer membrane lipoprotein-sorting protein n=1 Tax=Rhabdobacter roseus TaxID=1655419 RepID=A0A840TNX7_9BACT|nr:hypothetical protein [Rhabdobacter roseus]MBB5285996.1 outer membrane lipoprotein-sorting protein [Rhabdobacter roseus]